MSYMRLPAQVGSLGVLDEQQRVTCKSVAVWGENGLYMDPKSPNGRVTTFEYCSNSELLFKDKMNLIGVHRRRPDLS